MSHAYEPLLEAVPYLLIIAVQQWSQWRMEKCYRSVIDDAIELSKSAHEALKASADILQDQRRQLQNMAMAMNMMAGVEGPGTSEEAPHHPV